MRKLLVTLILAFALVCHGQTIVSSFDGDIGAGTSSNPDHPNPTADGNGTYKMLVTWQNVIIRNYAGATISTTPTLTFLGNAGFTCTYPAATELRVVYDRFISRWLVVTNCDGPKDLLVVSSGADPTTSTWKGVSLQVSPGSDPSMRIGYDKNWIVEVETAPCGGTPADTYIVIPQADAAWTGAGNVSLTNEHLVTCRLYEATPLIDYNPSKGLTAPTYFLSRVNNVQNQTNTAITLNVDTWTPTSSTAGSFSGSPTAIATVYLYNTPVDPAQPGSPSGVRSSESHRPKSMTSINSTDMQVLWESGPCSTAGTCNSEGVNTQGEVLWFDIATPGLTLIQQAKISNSSIGYIFPSMGLDSANNTVIVATGSSGSVFPSLYSWTHLASDAAGTMRGPTLLTSGTANYQVCNTTPHPGWGDYASTLQDAVDMTKLLTIGEYACSAIPCAWCTREIELQINPPSVPVPTMMASTSRSTAIQ